MSIYLDHAATSLPRSRSAIEAAIAGASLANPGRGLHAAQSECATRITEARAAVRSLVGSGGAVCFTSGATHALNQAILGMRPRPRAVALDPLVHNAVRRPVLRLGVPIWVLPHDETGRIDVAAARDAWQPIDLVVLTHGSNVTGLVQPAASIVELARKKGARTIVDAAQTAGLIPLDLGEPSVVALSAHKGVQALPGCGALVVAEGVELEPLLAGGTGFEALAVGMPSEYPARLEAGTPNIPGILAMGAAASESLEKPWQFTELASRLREAIARAGARLVGEGELPVASFVIDGVSPVEVEEILDRSFGITVRAGLHCSPSAHETLRTLPLGTVRASAGKSTFQDDLAAFEQALSSIRRLIPG